MKCIPIDPKRIRDRAHELWLQRGCPQGTEALDWADAERALRLEAGAPAAAATPPSPSTPTASGMAQRALPPRPTLGRAQRARVARLCNKIEPRVPPPPRTAETAPADASAKRAATGPR